jgi:hypothetical protein
VNANFDGETSALEYFRKFINEDLWQLFAEQTNIEAKHFLAANPLLRQKLRTD